MTELFAMSTRSARVLLPALKGAIMAIVLLAASVPFIQSLIVAAVSASLSGGFLLGAALIQRRSAEQLHREVKDVKKAIGAHRREEDEHPA